MNKLAPLVQADIANLAFATTADVVPLTGADPFAKTEDELIKEFDSTKTQLLILFLGVDEHSRLPPTGNGAPKFEYKNYKGSPYFAVDVTPRGTLTEAATALISSMQGKGFSFFDSPRHMALQAGQGAWQHPLQTTHQ
jgi:NAD+ diphosphatase